MTGYVADLSWKSGACAIEVRSTKVDAGDFKHELLNRLRSTMAVNVLILKVYKWVQMWVLYEWCPMFINSNHVHILVCKFMCLYWRTSVELTHTYEHWQIQN